MAINESEARVVRWMYATLVNGGSPEEMAEVLTEMAIPTGGRRRDGTLNTHWTASGIIAILRNEKHCGDVLARKTYTPNYKDHKSKRNNGKKNKYFQPDHHDAIVSRAMWNAAQWDMMAEARPLDIAHTVDTATVDDLLMEIMEDPPVLPQTPEAYAEPIQVDGSTEEV